MGLAIGMFVAYLPFFWWMYKERQDEKMRAKRHR
jgi:uncharacterized membrane protein YkgB